MSALRAGWQHQVEPGAADVYKAEYFHMNTPYTWHEANFVVFLTLLGFCDPPARPSHAHVGEERCSHGGPEVDKGDIAPVDGIPPRKVPRQVYVQAEGLDGVQMAQVGDEQDEQDRLPDTQVGGGAQDEGLVEGEEEVQVGKLGEHDGGASGDGRQDRGRRGVGQE